MKPTETPYTPVDGKHMLGKDAQRVLQHFADELAVNISDCCEVMYPKSDGDISEELGVARSYITRVRKHYNIPDVDKRREVKFKYLRETLKLYHSLHREGCRQYSDLQSRRLKDEASACTVGCIIGAITGLILGVLLF